MYYFTQCTFTLAAVFFSTTEERLDSDLDSSCTNTITNSETYKTNKNKS